MFNPKGWCHTARQLLLIALILPVTAQAANMTLSKHRILLDSKNKRDDLMVFNPSEDFQSYRVTVEDFAMSSEGKLLRTADFTASAQSFLRVGPRLGRNIAPNNSQKFRVMLRGKPQTDGEYRSHIVIEALLPPLPDEGEGVTARPNIKYSIPVIIRQGQLHASVNINQASIKNDEQNQGQQYLEIDFVRAGTRSVFGDIKAYIKGQPDKLMLQANSVGIYPEVSERQMRIRLQKELPHSGVLVIEFAENPEYGGNLTASYQLPLSPS